MLTSYFVIHGYLRDIGLHVNNLQRSVNDMEELVAIHDEVPGILDAPDATAAEGRGRQHRVRRRDVPLSRTCDAALSRPDGEHRAGERIGLVGRSGSGKTTFVKLIQRLYDVGGGRILIDGQDVAKATQASLRQQIAIVQQEPILFHRSLADNIAYGRPGRELRRDRRRRRGLPTRTSSSSGCRTATARWSASAA